MLRITLLTALVVGAVAAHAVAGKVQVNFLGGNGLPVVISLPNKVSFRVTNDTPAANSIFVFQGVGSFLGGISGASGSLSYTINGGPALAINSAGNTSLGGVLLQDLVLFRQGSPSVGLDNVVVLSSGTATTTASILQAAPPSGLYWAFLVDANGVELGVGAVVSELLGDFNVDGVVDAADYTVWRDTDGTPAGYDVWKEHFGDRIGEGAGQELLGATAGGVPEPASGLLMVWGLIAVRRGRRFSR